MFFTACALASSNSNSGTASRTCQTGFQYTPVASIATWVTPSATSQSRNSRSESVNVRNRRTVEVRPPSGPRARTHAITVFLCTSRPRAPGNDHIHNATMRHVMPAGRVAGMERAGAAALALVGGVTPLRVESALFEEMLAGWRRQQLSRRLGGSLIEGRERTVRRFQVFAESWPWGWRAEQLERWVAEGGWAHSTVRCYQGAVAAFCSYVTDPRYGWVAECEQRFGARPSQICHEDNTAAHVADYEGRRSGGRCRGWSARRCSMPPTTGRSDWPARDARGWLTAFRDATLLKVTYGWGLRCREVTMLDLTDFTVNPAAEQLGGLGVCHVRFGKAMRRLRAAPARGGQRDAVGGRGAAGVPGGCAATL